MKDVKRKGIRLLALLLCLMLSAVCAGSVFGVRAEEPDPSSGSQSPQSGGSYLLNNQYYSVGDLGPSSPNECWAYGNRFYNRIWGEYQNQNPRTTDNLLKQFHDSGNYEALKLTPDHLREYIRQCVPGTILRICGEIGQSGRDINGSQVLTSTGRDGYGHTQIIVHIDENGFTVFQGGYPNAPYYDETYYTWEGYAYALDCNDPRYATFHKYEYIKYLKFPGGSGMPQAAPAVDLSTLQAATPMDSLGLNLRRTMYLDLPNVQEIIYPGTEVFIYDVRGSWAAVIYQGMLLYCYRDYLTVIREPVVTDPPPTDPLPTDPPATDPPVTEPVTPPPVPTDPPQTEAPPTRPSETSPPATETERETVWEDVHPRPLEQVIDTLPDDRRPGFRAAAYGAAGPILGIFGDVLPEWQPAPEAEAPDPVESAAESMEGKTASEP